MKKWPTVIQVLILISAIAVSFIYQDFIIQADQLSANRIESEHLITVGPLLTLEPFTNETKNTLFVRAYAYWNMTITQAVIEDCDSRIIVTQPLSVPIADHGNTTLIVNCSLPPGIYQLNVTSTRGTHSGSFVLPPTSYLEEKRVFG